jgi:hypothetical protein
MYSVCDKVLKNARLLGANGSAQWLKLHSIYQIIVSAIKNVSFLPIYMGRPVERLTPSFQ